MNLCNTSAGKSDRPQKSDSLKNKPTRRPNRATQQSDVRSGELIVVGALSPFETGLVGSDMAAEEQHAHALKRQPRGTKLSSTAMRYPRLDAVGGPGE